MTEETPSDKKPEPLRPAIEEKPKEEKGLSGRVLIRPLPKIVFLWPTTVMALACFLIQSVGGGEEPSPRIGLVFYLVLALNLPIVAFEFSRVALLVLGLLVALFAALGFWTQVFGFVGGLQISASDQFYAWYFILMGIIYLFVFLLTRFNYWELTHNELLHHHGVLGDVERYPAPGLRITKEVNDVFEFILLGAGRLVIEPQGEDRALVLESVPAVNRVEKRMKELLSTLQVKLGGAG